MQSSILTRDSIRCVFSNILLVMLCLLPSIALAATTSIPAQPTVQSNCSVIFEMREPEGELSIAYQGEHYPLTDASPESVIDKNGFHAKGELVEYIGEPELNRAVIVVIQNKNGAKTIIDLDYDAESLSQQVATCLQNYGGVDANAADSNSPDAPIPTPTQLREQAANLGVDIADFSSCPCGEAFSAVQMDTPPWKIASLTLHAGLNGCTLRTNEKKNLEVIRAGGSSGAKQTNCWAKVGLTTTNQQVEYKPSKFPPFSQVALQACYNIIGAKARQWLQAGGEINFLDDPKNDAKHRNTYAGSMENLYCGVVR